MCARAAVRRVVGARRTGGTGDPPALSESSEARLECARTRAHASQKIIFTALRRGFALIGLYLGYIPL